MPGRCACRLGVENGAFGGLAFSQLSDTFKAMLRQIASLLLAAHFAALAGPLLPAHPLTGAMDACTEAALGHAGAHLAQPDACEDCSMPACDHMIVCAATSFAVTNDLAFVLFPLLAVANEVDPAAALPRSLAAPALPPPRA